MKKIDTYIIEKLKINKDSKVSDRDPRDAYSYRVGDIISAVYEYNSRHVHFFKVKGFKGKATIELSELGKKRVSGDWQNGTCVPDEEKESNKTFTARINKYGKLKYNDYYCSLWNGQPEDYYTD